VSPGGGARAAAAAATTGAVRHLYVHLPFCVHRCGYCDFVTVVGRRGEHGAYVDALLAELALAGREGGTPAGAVALGGADGALPLDSVFLGGGTPTFTDAAELARLLRALPAAAEVTVEANPETVTPELAAALREAGATRVSLGAQTFQPRLLEVLERTATPDDVRAAFGHLRAAGFDNVSLDLVYGIPGQSPADLAADLAEAVAFGPEHLSCYELEAKPGTRFTIAHGEELERQADAMEGYFETVVESLEAAGYRWYETANFCRTDAAAGPGRAAAPRDLRAQHNLGYWLARDYLGIGIGAVSTVAGTRWRNTVKLATYVEALARGEAPPRDVEPLDAETRATERLMLGLRLEEGIAVDLHGSGDLRAVLDADALERLARQGLIELGESGTLRLTRRGRFLGGGVTAELLA
jgi:oxygen-independent coproporphyrinogen-3 oxidase